MTLSLRDLPRLDRSVVIKIAITLAAIGLYNLGPVLPVPGLTVPSGKLTELLDSYALVKIHNHLIAGGGLNVGVGLLALGFLPYVQAKGFIAPAVEFSPELKNKTEIHPKMKERWTLFLTLLLAVLNATGFVAYTSGGWQKISFGAAMLPVVSLTAGAFLTILLINWINRKGVGEGLTVLATASVMSSAATWLSEDVPAHLVEIDAVLWFVAAILGGLLVFFLSLHFYRSNMVLRVVYASRSHRSRTGDVKSHPLPIRLDYASGDAVVSGAALLGTLLAISGLFAVGWPVLQHLQDTNSLFFLLGLLPFMALFSVLAFVQKINPDAIAFELKKDWGIIRDPKTGDGVRPGDRTAQFLRAHIVRLICLGLAIKAALIVALWAIARLSPIPVDPFALFSTLAVTIGFGTEMLERLQADQSTHSCEGLISKARVRR